MKRFRKDSMSRIITRFRDCDDLCHELNKWYVAIHDLCHELINSISLFPAKQSMSNSSSRGFEDTRIHGNPNSNTAGCNSVVWVLSGIG